MLGESAQRLGESAFMLAKPKSVRKHARSVRRLGECKLDVQCSLVEALRQFSESFIVGVRLHIGGV